ncbi:putative ribose-phosphate pyrophosphokinase [Nocardia nova SH22a]|uniref:ribose-phosphate diphosphokinase n=1 Tax=Nocardia nova SH22a TaxID=1415166 RepID=W5TGG9_9NOCA|nr:ribose-phosphate pyrophosphokinase [Nocardia nova]AHH18312.1 putative ribose-phosphate pyrophosphokinase [Nocardia nova SH22a]
MSSIRILRGSANPPLADAVAERVGAGGGGCEVQRWADGERQVVVDDVTGHDVYIVQPTSPPVAEHTIELLLMLDACLRAGAHRITAVVPYFGYARQDHSTVAGEALGARVAAEAIAHAGADRLIVVDPHSPTLEAICPIPVEVLTAVPLLADELAPALIGRGVVIAPDLAAGERAEHFASILRASVAVVRKHRLSDTSVRALDLLGEITGRPVALVDDMIRTGATIEAAARLVRHQATDTLAAATHGPLAEGAAARLHELGLRRIVVTDSVFHAEETGQIDVRSIAPLLAETIIRMHADYRAE